MRMRMEIADVHGREILDSRGNPTVEVEITLKNGVVGRASVPSGASTGTYEAIELRDKEHRYQGLGVKHAVHNINTILSDLLVGQNVFDQREIDEQMIEADGTEYKGSIGANAILGASLAVARAASNAIGLPLYRYLGGTSADRMPVPMMNIFNGGCHASNMTDIQEFMIMPVGAASFGEGLQMGAEVYHCLKKRLKVRGLSTAIGDEGGFASDLPNAKEVLSVISTAARDAGYVVGSDVVFALDVAASELYDREREAYYFPGESKIAGHEIVRDTVEMIQYLKELGEEFPICSIEDGLREEDFEGWRRLTQELGGRIQLVGDDLFVTNVRRLEKGIQMKAGNALLVKYNQIGTLTETMSAIHLAHKSGYRTIISHRSGETEDSFIADLSVAVGAGQIKTGAPCRSDRVAKYNRLLRIEEEIQDIAQYDSPFS